MLREDRCGPLAALRDRIGFAGRELARKSIRQGLNTLSVMVADAQDAGYGEGYDAAAAMILDQDHPTETKPVEFTDWMPQRRHAHRILIT